MGLDYSSGCVNFRDVGEWTRLIAGHTILPPGRLLRGGKLDFVEHAQNIGNPGTIINLRNGPDPLHCSFGAEHWHLPAIGNDNRYDTEDKRVRDWLNRVLGCIARDVKRWPLLLHCTSGKDRTGVAVAALLRVLDADDDIIVQEYLLSDGGVDETGIRRALAGLVDPARYFHRVDLAALRTKMLAP